MTQDPYTILLRVDELWAGFTVQRPVAVQKDDDVPVIVNVHKTL